VAGCFKKFAEELGRHGFLSFGGRICIFESSEEGFEGGMQVLASREVKGPLFEMVPKRRSQTAYGSFDSACDQWLLMSPFQLS
jgi:hypothetical protein